MQQENLFLNSSAIVKGILESEFKFSHEVYGEGFYTFYINISRLSEATDSLPVIISERLIDRSLLKIGAKVSITGQIRSYNNYSEETKRNKLILTIFARELEIIEDNNISNPNEIELNGYVCKTPVYRMTPFGREIADILLAVNRSYNKSDYIPCIAWGRNARFSGNLKVGDKIKVWGRMQSREYQKKLENGSVLEKTAYEVSISKLEYDKKQANDVEIVESDIKNDIESDIESAV